MTEDEKYMREAMLEAQKALAQDEIPIGAVVVANGVIIGRGHNLTETLHDVTAHAEMQAITAAAEYLGGISIGSARIGISDHQETVAKSDNQHNHSADQKPDYRAPRSRYRQKGRAGHDKGAPPDSAAESKRPYRKRGKIWRQRSAVLLMLYTNHSLLHITVILRMNHPK